MQFLQINKTVATERLYSFTLGCDVCKKKNEYHVWINYAVDFKLNHTSDIKANYTFLIVYCPPIDSVLSHMVVVFSFCLSVCFSLSLSLSLSLESILFWLLSPHAESRGSNSPPSYNWLSTHLLGTAPLSLSHPPPPSFCSLLCSLSLSFFFSDVLSCFKKTLVWPYAVVHA